MGGVLGLGKSARPPIDELEWMAESELVLKLHKIIKYYNITLYTLLYICTMILTYIYNISTSLVYYKQKSFVL